MSRADTTRAISHGTWWTIAVAALASVVVILAFVPWFRLDAAQEGVDLDVVLRVEQNGWHTVLGLLAVLTAGCGGALAFLPYGPRGLYVAVALVAALLALVRLAVPPSATIFGETLSYSRTGWVILAAAAALLEGGCAVLSASLRNQERVE